MQKPVKLGRITGLFGVKGWVKVFSYTEPREAILDYDRWYLEEGDAWRAVAIAEGRRHGKGVVVRIVGFDDRDQAQGLLDREVAVEREQMPAVDDGRFYWADLEGMQVRHCDGTDLGRVAYLLETGANDVLVTTGDPERLIPFIKGQVILDVDVAERVITVDWELD